MKEKAEDESNDFKKPQNKSGETWYEFNKDFNKAGFVQSDVKSVAWEAVFYH